MPSLVILGAQWGDEGKGKLVDVITEQSQVVARYQGGHNAGHTVVIGEDTFILHIIPSGILHPGKLSIIGNGTVVAPDNFIEEVTGLRAKGVKADGENLLLSNCAHLIMPYHIALDGANEIFRGTGKIGTTKRGIGPAYTDKMSRIGIRAGDLLYPQEFKQKLGFALAQHNAVLEKLYNEKPFDLDTLYDEAMRQAEFIAPHIADTDIVINRALAEGGNVLFEGAQGSLLDIDHGTYPYVTSSSATAGGVCIGLGVGPTQINKVIGIVKAYTTRVGEGPFPTELDNAIGEDLRARGGEYGATTGRPRRCGWLDMVALRHAVRVNGMTGFALTKLDILDTLDEIKICTSYRIGDKEVSEFPKMAPELAKAQPVYGITMKGWKANTSGVTKYDALPDGAKKYIEKIEELMGIRAEFISTGAKRDAYIMRVKPY